MWSPPVWPFSEINALKSVVEWYAQRCAAAEKGLATCNAKYEALIPNSVEKIAPPILLGDIDVTTIYDMVGVLLGQDFVAARNIKVLSGKYKLTTTSEILRFGAWAKINRLPYNDYHICNDFAVGFAGAISNHPDWWSVPMGMIVGMKGALAGHDVNITVACESATSPTPRIYFIEPQLNQVMNITVLAGQIDCIWIP